MHSQITLNNDTIKDRTSNDLERLTPTKQYLEHPNKKTQHSTDFTCKLGAFGTSKGKNYFKPNMNPNTKLTLQFYRHNTERMNTYRGLKTKQQAYHNDQ